MSSKRDEVFAVLACATCCLAACQVGVRQADDPFPAADSGAATTTEGSTVADSATAGGSTGANDDEPAGPKLDVGSLWDLGPDDPDSGTGCQKIDFLFVVDNSGSMGDEQTACTPPQDGCDGELGGGRVTDPEGNDCGVVGGQRFMTDVQPDLSATFTCLAEVGVSGDGNERPMEAMTTSLTTLAVAGECNEGFLRDDAILVVTFITDEEDNGKSVGNPATWKDALVGAKGGNEDAVVMLGILGDTGIAGTPCALSGEAENAPSLRTFADSFSFGSWGSVCAANYSVFFDAAVSVVDGACDIFEPEG